MDEYDLLIVGGGPAGLTAGIYAVRAEMRALVLEGEMPGGKIGTAGIVENYPGFAQGIMGIDLAEAMAKQAQNAGVEVRSLEKVTKIERKDKKFLVATAKGQYLGKTVLIATGMRDRKMGVPGEKELSGRGVSYCFTCDGPLYRGKRVAVLGSGTGAVEAAVYLVKLAKEVNLIAKRDKVTTAEKIMQRRLEASDVKITTNAETLAILGDEKVSGVKIRLKTGGERTVDTDGVFVEVGKSPNSELLKGLVEMDKGGFIVVDRFQRTSIPGLYAAGDVTTSNAWKQLGVAVAEGTTAALDAYRYIQENF